MTTVLVLVLVLLVSAAVQASTGFGYALVSAPTLAAILGPAAAISTIVVTGAVVDCLILLSERRRPAPRWRDVVGLGLWSLPGLAVGTLALALLPRSALQVLVAGGVLLGVATRATRMRARSAAAVGPPPRWLRPVAGLASGALSTSTTLGGPPVVLYLTRQPRPPQETRDTLVTLSLFRLPTSVLALAIADAWRMPPALPLLLPAVLAGYLCGRVAFARLDLARYERVVLGLLVCAAVAATAIALA
jgi:uncharacterized protein